MSKKGNDDLSNDEQEMQEVRSNRNGDRNNSIKADTDSDEESKDHESESLLNSSQTNATQIQSGQSSRVRRGIITGGIIAITSLIGLKALSSRNEDESSDSKSAKSQKPSPYPATTNNFNEILTPPPLTTTKVTEEPKIFTRYESYGYKPNSNVRVEYTSENLDENLSGFGERKLYDKNGFLIISQKGKFENGHLTQGESTDHSLRNVITARSDNFTTNEAGISVINGEGKITINSSFSNTTRKNIVLEGHFKDGVLEKGTRESYLFDSLLSREKGEFKKDNIGFISLKEGIYEAYKTDKNSKYYGKKDMEEKIIYNPENKMYRNSGWANNELNEELMPKSWVRYYNNNGIVNIELSPSDPKVKIYDKDNGFEKLIKDFESKYPNQTQTR